ncbi:MAG: MAC/perforin domain-containing protein [Betaproteobacteria bacterium]
MNMGHAAMRSIAVVLWLMNAMAARLRIARTLLVFIACIACTDSALAQDIRGVWRLRNSDQAVAPDKLDVPGVDPFFHGSYEADPYLLVEPGENGVLRLISDGMFRANLTPVAGRDAAYSVVPDGATESIATLLSKDSRCGVRPRCLVFADVKDASSLRAGVEDVYVPMVKKVPPDDPDKRLQIYRDMFTPIPSNFGLVRICYDLTKMSPDNFQLTGCEQYLFDEPDALSLDYEKVAFPGKHENTAVPYGWTYVSAVMAEGKNNSHIFESGRELADTQQQTIGFKIGANIGPVEMSAHYSKTTKDRVENMYAKDLTYSQFDFLKTEYALILDKSNVKLSEAFRAAVRDLKVTRDFDYFLSQFGTHYAYASTFGARGQRFMTMNKDQVVTLHETGTDITAGASVGLGVPGEGGVSVGVDGESAQTHLDKMRKILGAENESFYCVGGTDCQSGVPNGDAVVPVLLDLRPISDLLGPPFYDDDAVLSDLRPALAKAIADRVFFRRDDAGEISARFARIGDPSIAACGNTRFGDREPFDTSPPASWTIEGRGPPTFSGLLWRCCLGERKISALQLGGSGQARIELAGGVLPANSPLIGFMPDGDAGFIDNMAIQGDAPDYSKNWPGGDASQASFFFFGSCRLGCPDLPPPFPSQRELIALPAPLHSDDGFKPLSGFGLEPLRAVAGMQFKDDDCKAVKLELSLKLEPLTAKQLLQPSNAHR